MSRPFPGMDPYLESPEHWDALHTQMIPYIVADLQPQIITRYRARPEQRVLLSPLDEEGPRERRPDVGIREVAGSRLGSVAVLERSSSKLGEMTVPERIVVPDLTIPHRFIEIVDLRSRRIVSVIEVLSPWNKSGAGYQDYREKQRLYLLSEVNLIEIDLLRGGRPAIALPASRLEPADYRICIHFGGSRLFDLIRFSVRDTLPTFAVPLREDDSVALHLEGVVSRAYEDGGYRYEVDYDVPCDPPLSPADAAWAEDRIRSWRAA